MDKSSTIFYDKPMFNKYGTKILLYIVVVLGSVLMFLPFFWMVLTSLKMPQEIQRMPMTWLPDNFFNMRNYFKVFSAQPFFRFFINSAIVTTGTTITSLFFCAITGYGFAKFKFPGKDIIFFGILSVLMMPFEITVIPLYLIFNALNLTNTYLGLMAPDLISAFGVFLMRQFIEGIPNDYIEAGRVEGASEFKIFFRLILPLLKPVLATLAVIKFLMVWNDFLWPLVVVQDISMKTLALGLSDFAGMWYTDYTVICAASFLTMIPTLIIFIMLQKYVVQGITMSGLKG